MSSGIGLVSRWFPIGAGDVPRSAGGGPSFAPSGLALILLFHPGLYSCAAFASPSTDLGFMSSPCGAVKKGEKIQELWFLVRGGKETKVWLGPCYEIRTNAGIPRHPTQCRIAAVRDDGSAAFLAGQAMRRVRIS